MNNENCLAKGSYFKGSDFLPGEKQKENKKERKKQWKTNIYSRNYYTIFISYLALHS